MPIETDRYKIELLDGGEETIEAYYYETSGDFVDFYQPDGRGGRKIALRLRANAIESVRLDKD